MQCLNGFLMSVLHAPQCKAASDVWRYFVKRSTLNFSLTHKIASHFLITLMFWLCILIIFVICEKKHCVAIQHYS